MSDSPFAPRVESFDLASVVAETIAEHGLPMKGAWELIGTAVAFHGTCVLADGTSTTWSVRCPIKGTRTRELVRQHTEAALLRVHQFLEEAQAEGSTFEDAMTPEQRYRARTAPAEVAG